jgi:hypothetical protein
MSVVYRSHKKRKNDKTIYNTSELDINRDNTIIIIDWDDTLYPTSWIMNNNIDLTDPKSRYRHVGHFKELDKHLESTLKHMKKLGDVIIITNAMPEWVELSLSVLPKTKECMSSIDIISARKRYQNQVSMSMWKELTFLEEIDKRVKKQKYKNILSLGDAEYEYKALINLYKLDILPHKYLKAIRFIKSSDYNILVDQLKVIRKNISNICSLKRHLDLTFGTK